MSVVCIGGACVDRKYLCIGPAQPGTSNPARARSRFGGVARNVAEHLALMGTAASLFTVVGDDESGNALLEDAQLCGVDTTLSIRSRDEVTGEYAAVIGDRGELLLGVSDMHAVESISVKDVDERWGAIARADFLFVDCNVTAAVLGYCIERARASSLRLAIDAVSEAKVRRLPARLDGVSVLLLNEGEAAAYLSGADEPKQAAQRIRERGASAAVLTMGARGLIAAADAVVEISAREVACVDSTGAGDALVAATIAGLLGGDGVADAARAGTLRAAQWIAS